MPTYNDGSVPYGFGAGIDLYDTPAGASIGTYVLESLTLDEGGFQIERRNGSNVMSGRVAGDDSNEGAAVPLNITGTARVQRATSSTVAPKVGNALYYPGGDLPAQPLDQRYLIITGVSHTYGQAEAHTFDVRWAVTGENI
jgi:hypothetical protein